MATACQGTLEAPDILVSSDLLIEDVVLDSRAFIHTSLPTLFVALRGERFDGHAFLAEAKTRGVAAALVERGRRVPQDLPVIRVDDTLEALQSIASAWRAWLGTRVIGITGSNGKTIIKEMLAAVLSRQFTLHRSPGSYNSQVGVALSLLGLRPEHELAIIEAGISEAGEMHRLEAMIRPDFGIISNIGMAHAAGLGTLENTAREKLQLFGGEQIQWLVWPAQDKTLGESDTTHLPPRRIFSVDLDREVAPEAVEGVHLWGAHFAEGTWQFHATFADGQTHAFELHAPGEHNLANAAATITAARELGVSVEEIQRGLALHEVAPMRLEIHTTPAGVTLINDAYNADPVSARAALTTLRQHAGAQRKIAILGDMLDLGARAESAHRELGALLATSNLDGLFLIGEWAKVVLDAARGAGMPAPLAASFEDLDTLQEHLEHFLQPEDVVLVKASRAVGLDRVAARLLESVGPTRLVIDLGAIRQNFHAVRRRLGGDVGVMAVVKSFGYGNDATRVSMTLAREGVDALAVAYPDEAIPLRKMGLDLPILVNNTLASEADKIVKYGLTGLIYSERTALALEAQAAKAGEVVDVHLKIDTGMRRVGLEPDAALDFARRCKRLPHLRIVGAMTHLAAADEKEEDAFTREQLARFAQSVSTLREDGFELQTVHAANTSAAWRFPEARFDMVRLGIGLYGLHPSDAVASSAQGTRSAMSFETRIIHLKWIEAGESVGYGRSWYAKRRTQVATIAVGYNDGFSRAMSNGGEVLIRGRRVPVIGRVCMDVSMVDVTDLGEEVAIDDPVILFGQSGEERITVDALAARAGTISYEILTNISPRVRRIFTAS
jgi:alanine racemase